MDPLWVFIFCNLNYFAVALSISMHGDWDDSNSFFSNKATPDLMRILPTSTAPHANDLNIYGKSVTSAESPYKWSGGAPKGWWRRPGKHVQNMLATFHEGGDWAGKTMFTQQKFSPQNLGIEIGETPTDDRQKDIFYKKKDDFWQTWPVADSFITKVYFGTVPSAFSYEEMKGAKNHYLNGVAPNLPSDRDNKLTKFELHKPDPKNDPNDLKAPFPYAKYGSMANPRPNLIVKSRYEKIGKNEQPANTSPTVKGNWRPRVPYTSNYVQVTPKVDRPSFRQDARNIRSANFLEMNESSKKENSLSLSSRSPQTISSTIRFRGTSRLATKTPRLLQFPCQSTPSAHSELGWMQKNVSIGRSMSRISNCFADNDSSQSDQTSYMQGNKKYDTTDWKSMQTLGNMLHYDYRYLQQPNDIFVDGTNKKYTHLMAIPQSFRMAPSIISPTQRLYPGSPPPPPAPMDDPPLPPTFLGGLNDLN